MLLNFQINQAIHKYSAKGSNMATQGANRLIRKLKGFELFVYYTHKFMDSTYTPFIRIAILGEINESILRQALNYVQLKHPLLQVCLEESKGEVFFAKMKAYNVIPLSILKNTNNDEWKNIGLKETRKKFDDEKGPLIKLILLKDEVNNSHDLIAVYHHSIADNISIKTFFKDLLSIYSKIQYNVLNDDDIHELPIPASSLDPVMAEDFQQIHIASDKFSIKRLIAQIGDFFITLKKSLIVFFKEIGMKSDSFQDAILTKELTTALSNSCHSHNVTLEAFLWAVLLSCIKEEYNQKKYNIATLISTRRFYIPKISDEIIGCYLSSYNMQIVTKDLPKDIWIFAKFLNDIVSTNALANIFNQPKPPPGKIMPFIMWLIKIKISLGYFFNSSKLSTIYLSHAGELFIQNSSMALKIRAYNRGGNRFREKSISLLTIILNNELNISLSSSLLPSEYTEAIMKKMLSRLMELKN